MPPIRNYEQPSYHFLPRIDSGESACRKTARIQVKSRWATDGDKSFPIKNFDCDFVVLAMLNRGYNHRKKGCHDDNEIRDPDFYVIPVDVVKNAQNIGNKWGTVRITNISDHEKYKGNWSLIADFLST